MIPQEWIKYSASFQGLVLTGAPRRGKANSYLECVTIPVKMNHCFPLG